MLSLLLFFIFQFYSFLVLFLPLLIVMAFITLLERKVMGIMQRRRGPNVVGFFGILQPFADGIKLLLKEPVFPFQSDMLLFIFSPLLTFFVSLLSWSVIPISSGISILDLNISLLFVLGSSSLGVYGILLAGWSSNSKYSFFGSIRSAAQMISYEVAMTLAIFPVFCLAQSFSLRDIVLTQASFGWFLFSLFPSAICFFICLLAETNRSPFDLPEAEGELVAGYNVEYSAFFFAFFYLAEYLNILLLSTVFVIFFMGGDSFFFLQSSFLLACKVFLIVYIVIWVRATLPRYRYDQLMMLGWKILLPFTTGYTLFVSGVFFFYVEIWGINIKLMEILLVYNTFQQLSSFFSFFELFLFTTTIIIGASFGIFCLQGNFIIIFMCFEIILVALAFNFSLISFFFSGSSGFVFAYLILIIAGAESALSLSILTSFFFVEQHIQVEFLTKLKG